MSTQNLLNLKIHKVAEEPTTYEDPTAIYLVPDNGHTHGNITNEGTLSAANHVVVTDDNKKITTSPNITTTELGYLNGVSSSIQTQLNGKAPTSHASSATTYGVASSSNYGHAKASSTTPRANGTATVGSETSSFARGDHVHPTDTSRAAAKLGAVNAVVVTDSSKNITTSSTITTTELGYLDGVTSNIQTQLGTKMPKAGGTFTDKITTVGSKYVEDATNGNDLTRAGLNMANSDIVGCNSIYFQDGAEYATEGIQFFGSSSTVHSLWCTSTGTLYYTPKRALGTKSTDGSFSVDASGNVSGYSFSAKSDRRLKENIIEYRSEKSILDLPVYKYNFISDENKKEHLGCLAQDLQEICPEIVNEDKDGYLAIQESKIVYLLLKEVKKLKKELDMLKNSFK